MTNKIKLKFVKAQDVLTPSYGTEGAACFDFYAPETIEIKPGFSHKISLGLKFEIPEGYAMHILPRSSTGVKTTLRMSNNMGVIDSDYRGIVHLLLDNLGDKTYVMNKGERLAQGYLQQVIQATFVEVEELTSTERGDGGFGSTGS